jgi:hypothetical protein
MSFSNYEFVKLISKLIGGGLSSGHTVASLLRTPLVGKASWKNDLGITPIMDLTNSKFDQLQHYL